MGARATLVDAEAAKLTNVNLLTKGAIYPDVIESAASRISGGHVIKSHHNEGGLPEDMKLKVVGALRELFKGEVREIGPEPGLPYDGVCRHPSSARPGLGVRILGEVKKEYAGTLRAVEIIDFMTARWAHLPCGFQRTCPARQLTG